MSDDLTNPTVLEALEIAEVGWNSIEGHWFQLGASESGKRVVVNDISGHFWSEVTPADLDHALKEWPRWLTRQFRQVGFERVSVKIAFRDKDWGENRGVCDVTGFRRDGGCVMLATAEGWSPLLAVAVAVVKLKPKAEENDNV